MTKTTICVLAAAALAASLGSASAADLARGPAPYYQPAPVGYNWNGFYAGINAGYEWGKVTNISVNPGGFAGGLQAGYNWEMNQFVLGVEADIQGSGADDTFAAFKFSNPWFGTVRGRMGYAFNNILVYGTLGLAYGGLHGEIPGASENRLEAGWTGGLGLEVGFSQNWSAKVEYLYMDLADRSFGITAMDNGLQTNLFRFGLNYHF